jgi:hypothetical protein
MSVLDWRLDLTGSRDCWTASGDTHEFKVYELGDDGNYEFWVHERDTGVEVAHGWSRSQLYAIAAIRTIVDGAGRRPRTAVPESLTSVPEPEFVRCPGANDGKRCVRDMNHPGQCLVVP